MFRPKNNLVVCMGIRHLRKRVTREESKVDEELRALIESRRTQIKVVGTGGAGNNTISRLMEVGIVGAETIAINTDAQDLLYTDADKKILIGRETTGGLGAGADPQLGMEAARESKEEIKKALEGADLVFLTCGLGGGCLRGDSLILTNPGKPVRIDSIKPGELVYTIDENGELVSRKVLAAMETGIKEIYEIKTNNRTIYASYDHPFLKVVKLNKLSNGRFSKFALKWEEAQNLKVGDLVVILRKIPDNGKPYRLPNGELTDEKFCRLFGFLIGDGWISRSKKSWKILFSPSTDQKKNEFYKKLIEEKLGVKVKRGKNWYYGKSKKAYELLKELGLNKKAKEKEIPSWIFGLPENQKKAFILGLADADGYYYKSKNRNGKMKIELRFEMSSEKLIRQLKILCDSIGLRTSNIYHRKRKIKPPHSKGLKEIETWGVRIYKLHQLDKKFENGRERNGIGFLYGFRKRKLPKFFEWFGFQKIKQIKKVGKEKVYDITVEGSHNFIAEGFVVHNTGTGSIPVIAEISKKLGALTIAIVTLPFSMEGKHRMENAKLGLKNLKDVVDTLIVIPNDKLLEVVPNVSLLTAFKICDEILVNAVKGITELITKPGLVNLDFADVRAVMKNGGLAMIGVGESDTENRAVESVKKALNNPLLDVDFKGAKGALINVVGGPDMTIKEAQQIVETVFNEISADAKIIWGAQVDDSLGEAIRTTVVLTGVSYPKILKLLEQKKDKKDIEKILDVEFLE